MPAEGSFQRIATNRKALHEFTVESRIEAGIRLLGTEVKSLREGHATLTGSFCRVQDGKVTAFGVNIPPYECGNRFNHNPDRPKPLLLHQREIDWLTVQVDQKGLALIPLSLYFRRGFAKLELGVCKGKRMADKRDTLRRRTADREAAREIAHRR